MTEEWGGHKEEHDVEREDKLNARAIFWRRILVGFLVVWMLVMTTLAAVGIVLIRNTQQAGSPSQQRIIGIAEQIQSCTDPEGECSKRGAKAQAEAVAAIITGNSAATRDIISAALSCQADGFTEKRALLDCTVERSKED